MGTVVVVGTVVTLAVDILGGKGRVGESVTVTVGDGVGLRLTEAEEKVMVGVGVRVGNRVTVEETVTVLVALGRADGILKSALKSELG